MTTGKTSGITAEILDRYTELITTQPDIVLKGATMPYTSVNGNMFSFISPDGRLNVRLSKSDKAVFMQLYSAAETVQHGVVMKEYVVVPDAIWNDTEKLRQCFSQSCEYARGLKEKATARRKE